jgi:peptide/nickel transport system ATP-binding protein
METILIHDAMRAEDAEARTREVMTRVGLPPAQFPLTRYPHELSGGQRQRVVIAMAIALRPKLLISDEPTTALDVTTQAQILDLLKDLAREQDMALMMITHDLAVVSDMADTLCVMRQGEIVESGPTTQVLAEMRHPYTRALFEASRHQADLSTPVANDTLLSVSNVSRDYRLPRTSLFGAHPIFRAVKNVSFDIKRGERVGLVGESGCGKSTLTRAILGLEPTQHGQITLDGAPVWEDTHPNLAVRRKMQVVFQDPYGSFNPRHRVGRLITEPFHLLDDPPKGADRERAIADALTAVGLTPDDAHRHIHAFSGGQRQRIAIARALIIKPELIVFDEAVSALDVRVRAQILDLMADLSREYGLTYLFISHDLSVVRSITDRILVMRAGEIVEDRPTQDVFAHPEHPYTKSLLAAAPRLPDIGDLAAVHTQTQGQGGPTA